MIPVFRNFLFRYIDFLGATTLNSISSDFDRNNKSNNIYWTPKETLRSCLLYYFIKCDYIAFLHLVKVLRNVFRTTAKFEPVQWSGTFVGRYVRFARPARDLYFRALWRWKKNSTVEGKCSKTTKNHHKLIIKRIRKAPYLEQYTEIGKVIKRFRKAAFTDHNQCQFVLKLSGHLSFIILNLCTK